MQARSVSVVAAAPIILRGLSVPVHSHCACVQTCSPVEKYMLETPVPQSVSLWNLVAGLSCAI